MTGDELIRLRESNPLPLDTDLPNGLWTPDRLRNEVRHRIELGATAQGLERRRSAWRAAAAVLLIAGLAAIFLMTFRGAGRDAVSPSPERPPISIVNAPETAPSTTSTTGGSPPPLGSPPTTSVSAMVPVAVEPVLSEDSLPTPLQDFPIEDGFIEVILFHRGGDLLLTDPGGSVIVKVADLDSEISWADLSPSGETIAFHSDGTIFGLDIGNSQVRSIVEGTDEVSFSFPRWAPDGGTIAVWSLSEADELQIMLVAPDGSEQRRIGGGDTHDWSPDGTQLVTVFGSEAGCSPRTTACSSESSVLIVIDAETGERQELSPNPHIGPWEPKWSPDGSKVVYSDEGNGIWVVDLAKSEHQIVVPSERGNAASDPSWSPLGDQIIYTRGGMLWIASADGSSPQMLGGAAGFEGSEPEWYRIPVLPRR